jgi:peptidoglycan/xylan/chitin deacetylase (PgdA/CDA1 family)
MNDDRVASGLAGQTTRALKQYVKRCLASEAGWRFCAPFLRPPCLVLAYHRVSDPDDPFPHVDIGSFRRQMQWLRQHCQVIAADQLISAIHGGDRRLPVVITFDDGYRSYYEHAFPVLEGLGIPCVNFLSTQFIDEGGLFWWDEIHLAAERTSKPLVVLPWTGERIILDPNGRRTLARACKNWLKMVRQADQAAALRHILRMLDVEPGELGIPRQVMTWEEVRATMPLTAYGGHLHTHSLVSRLDEQRLEVEIRTCRDRIAAETGILTRLFAYPDGDITDQAKALLGLYGFEMAFTVTEGYNGADVDWLEIKRFPGPRTVEDLAWLVAGFARANAPAPDSTRSLYSWPARVS